MTTWGQGPTNITTPTFTEQLDHLDQRLTLVEHQLTQINDAITELLKTIPLPKMNIATTVCPYCHHTIQLTGGNTKPPPPQPQLLPPTPQELDHAATKLTHTLTALVTALDPESGH